jgi:hypothetical protein
MLTSAFDGFGLFGVPFLRPPPLYLVRHYDSAVEDAGLIDTALFGHCVCLPVREGGGEQVTDW